MSNVCVIVEVEGAADWAQLSHGGSRIPADHRPTVLQCTREAAEAEAIRLAKAHPGRRFAVFEAVSMGVTARIPTHVTLGGTVVVERNEGVLVQLNDDQIPF